MRNEGVLLFLLPRSDLWGMKEYYDKSVKRQQESRVELERKAGRGITGEPRPKRWRLEDGTERIEMELRFIRYSTICVNRPLHWTVIF